MPAAAHVRMPPVFVQGHPVGVPGPGGVLDGLVGAGIHGPVVEEDQKRGAGGPPLENPGLQQRAVILPPGRGARGPTPTAALQIRHELGFLQGQPRRATVDNTANSDTVAFTKGGDGK